MDDVGGDGAQAEDSSAWSEGLRERKKRLTRSLISNTATAMFLEQGFEDVKVADVAAACGLSEKTVYNYFPTKESLLFDREPEVAAEIWRVLGPGSGARSPVAAMLELLEVDRLEMARSWRGDGGALFRRFTELIDATPSLQAAFREMSDRLERTATEALAQQSGVSPAEPEPRIAAAALMALWRIQYDAFRRFAAEIGTVDETLAVVRSEVERAARVAESGLWWFGAAEARQPTRQQLKAATEAALAGGLQILTAIRQARATWGRAQREDERSPVDPKHGVPALADLIEETARWKHEMVMQRDEWKRAYREEQAKRRAAARELARQFRRAAEEHHRASRGGSAPSRGKGRASPSS